MHAQRYIYNADGRAYEENCRGCNATLCTKDESGLINKAKRYYIPTWERTFGPNDVLIKFTSSGPARCMCWACYRSAVAEANYNARQVVTLPVDWKDAKEDQEPEVAAVAGSPEVAL